LGAALKELRGDIYQSPPEFSAVKVAGKTGYEIVRTAEGDDLRERLVHVYRYGVDEFVPPKVAISMSVTKGVSVRALVRDIGRALGCGACVEDCRRTKCGIHTVDGAIPFVKLMEMHPADFATRLVPKNRMLA
jgi:tRNA pseudouridine55 synthase